MNATWYEGARNLIFAIILLALNDATIVEARVGLGCEEEG